MNTGWRATCRAAGQLGLLYYSALALYGLVMLVHDCQSGVSDFCTELVSLDGMGLPASAVVALVGFWASCRHRRREAAKLCAAMIIVYVVNLLWSYGHVSGSFPTAMPFGAGPLAVIGPLVLLLLSYRGKQPELDEPSPGRWIWIPLALLMLHVALYYLPFYLPFNLPFGSPSPSTTMIEMLVAGGLYGVLRGSRPLPGAASWLPVSLVLAGLALPAATLTRWTVRPAEPGWGAQAWQATGVWLAQIAVVVVLGAAQWAVARRARAGARSTDPSSAPSQPAQGAT